MRLVKIPCKDVEKFGNRVRRLQRASGLLLGQAVVRESIYSLSIA